MGDILPPSHSGYQALANHRCKSEPALGGAVAFSQCPFSVGYTTNTSLEKRLPKEQIDSLRSTGRAGSS